MPNAAEALAALEALGEARIREGLGRYGIATADRVIGVRFSSGTEGCSQPIINRYV